MNLLSAKPYLLPISTVAFTTGAMIVVGVMSFNLTPELAVQALGIRGIATLVAGFALLSLGAIVGGLGLAQLSDASAYAGNQAGYNRDMYRRYLVGLGYALLLLAVLNLEGLAGIAASGAIATVFPNAEKPASKTGQATALTAPQLASNASAVVLLFALSMAVLGALFFLTNSLQDSKDKDFDFDVAAFWGGFWYRLGEAVLFTIVAFLAFARFSTDPAGNLFSLPIAALLLGMFIRTGEQLIFGLSKRLLLCAQALIPLGLPDSTNTAPSPVTPGQES